MKQSLILFTFAFAVLGASAESLYDQLCTFNFNWKKYAQRAPEGDACAFASETEYIQAHLSSVLEILRTNPTDGLSGEQLASRTRLIVLLDGYRMAGKFPINYYRRERIPVFIDEHNTHCAVGYLMAQSGYGKLANRIAMTDNYVWVKDIKDPEALAWQQRSGFSLEELKLIQGAYDFYWEGARTAPNRIEIPQKPVADVAYFDTDAAGRKATTNTRAVWFKGEGQNGVLNGRWEQNYAIGMPWIIGFYDNGKRTGKWEEYYQGTRQLCRTEHWKNDKLNGVRTRFDREGRIIEEILFRDGNAVTKINYELETGQKWVRSPIDSTLVWTRLYAANGELLASGREKVHNTGNLKWFQNIELTALNTMAISARDLSSNTNGLVQSFDAGGHRINMYDQPALVEYKKEGSWTYYRQKATDFETARLQLGSFDSDLPLLRTSHLGDILSWNLLYFGEKDLASYDSIRVTYSDNLLQDLICHGPGKLVHWHVNYHASHSRLNELPVYWHGYKRYVPTATVSEVGQYNTSRQRIGEWKHYDRFGSVYMIEQFILPKSEEELREERYGELMK